MNFLQDLLPGKKTFIIAALAAVVFLLSLFGVISSDAANQILKALLIAGGITLRLAIAEG